MILISVVGEYSSNIIPLFYEFKHEIKYKILIYDKNDSKKADNILKGLQYLKNKYHLDVTFGIFEVDEDSFDSLNKVMDFLMSKSLSIEDVFLNLSDGHHAITIFTVKLFSERNVKYIVYDKLENEYLLIKDNIVQKLKPSKSVPIIDHLLSRGLDVIEYRTMAEIKERKMYIYKLFNRFSYYMELRNLIMHRSIIDIEDEKIKLALRKLGVIDRRGIILNKEYMAGNIFEDYIALVISEFPVEEVIVGCKVYLDEKKKVQNEFDVLFMYENHLHMIECKIRRWNNSDFDSLIYKYDSLISVIDDDSKAMIINLHKMNNYERYGFVRQASRAKFLEVGLFSINKPKKEEISKLISKFFKIKKT